MYLVELCFIKEYVSSDIFESTEIDLSNLEEYNLQYFIKNGGIETLERARNRF